MSVARGRSANRRRTRHHRRPARPAPTSRAGGGGGDHWTPDWEPLADALKRVVASGVAEDQAKTDLCRAISDRKIDVRVRIAATDHGMRGRIFSDGNVDVPAHLEPHDFDWEQSRPIAQWQIGPRPGEHYLWVGGWQNRPLDLIDASTADVINVLCNGADGENHNQAPALDTGGISPAAIQKSRGRSRPARERALRVIEELYPNGVPDQATEPNVTLCRRVGAKLKDPQRKLLEVSDDTILRAAKRRK